MKKKIIVKVVSEVRHNFPHKLKVHTLFSHAIQTPSGKSAAMALKLCLQ